MMDGNSDQPKNDSAKAETPAEAAPKAETSAEAAPEAAPTPAPTAAAASDKEEKAPEPEIPIELTPKRRALYKNFSFLISTGLLALGTLYSIPWMFSSDEKENPVALDGSLKKMSLIRGPTEEENVIEFEVGNKPRIFTVTALHVADQQLLVQELPGAYFKFTVTESDWDDTSKKKIEVLSLHTLRNVYIGEVDYKREMLKLRFFAALFAAIGFVVTLTMGVAAKKTWKKTMEAKPEDHLRPDPVLLGLAEASRMICLIAAMGFFGALTYLVDTRMKSPEWRDYVVLGVGGIVCFFVYRLVPRIQFVREILFMEAKAKAQYGASKPQTEKPGYMKALDLLLRNPKRINAQNPTDGHTPLHIAVTKGHVEVVDILLKRGAQVDLKDKNGETALILAVKGNSLGIVLRLLEAGSDPTLAGADGKKISEIARANKNKGIGSAVDRAVAQYEAKKRAAELNKKPEEAAAADAALAASIESEAKGKPKA